MTKKETEDKRIKTIEQLIELTADESGLECHILLNGA